MTELPQGWVRVALGQFAKPTRPRRKPLEYPNLPFVGMEQVESHTRRLLGTLSAVKMKSSAFHFQSGDVLYGRLRPYLNKVLCPDFEGLCSSEFIVLPPAESFEPKFLACYLSTDRFVQFANQLNKGDRPRVSFDQIAEHKIPLAPLNEQRRIVEKLEKLLSRVDAAQVRLATIPHILKRFRQSVLAAACSGQLTSDWRSTHLSAKSNGNDEGRSATDWQQLPFGELVASSFYGPRFSKESYSDSGTPTIRTTDMGFDGSISVDTSPCLRLSKDELHKYGLKHGDLLVTRTGATIGKCALYDRALGPALPSAYLIRFRLKSNLVVPKFALFLFMSPRGQQMLVGGSTAVAQPNVNATTISQFPISLPTVPEQKEIVRRVEALFKTADALEARYRKAKEHIDKLTQSILAKAFRGELVAQDPSDEPASVLLSRIAAAGTKGTEVATAYEKSH